MHVAVAIVGFRNSSDVSRCLSALSDSHHADFEVVICENGGETSFEELRALLPEQLPGGQTVRILQAPTNLGYGGGVNLCIAQSQDADAWWVLNPDTAPKPGALSALLLRLAEGDCDLVGGIMHDSQGVIENYGGRWRPWLGRTEAIGPGESTRAPASRPWVEGQISYAHGGSMLVSKRFVEVTGLMREDYFLYGEEVEWCHRGVRSGMRIGFAQAALVEHTKGTTTGSGGSVSNRPKLPIYMDERNKLLIVRDHYPQRLLIAAVAALAFAFLRYARRGAWRQLGYALAGWAAGLANRRGPPRWIKTSGVGT